MVSGGTLSKNQAARPNTQAFPHLAFSSASSLISPVPAPLCTHSQWTTNASPKGHTTPCSLPPKPWGQLGLLPSPFLPGQFPQVQWCSTSVSWTSTGTSQACLATLRITLPQGQTSSRCTTVPQRAITTFYTLNSQQYAVTASQAL